MDVHVINHILYLGDVSENQHMVEEQKWPGLNLYRYQS